MLNTLPPSVTADAFLAFFEQLVKRQAAARTATPAITYFFIHIPPVSLCMNYLFRVYNEESRLRTRKTRCLKSIKSAYDVVFIVYSLLLDCQGEILLKISQEIAGKPVA